MIELYGGLDMKKWKILSPLGLVALMVGLYFYGSFDYLLLYANDMEPNECPSCNGKYLHIVKGCPTDVASRMAKKQYVTISGCPNPFARNTRKCIDCGYPVVEQEKNSESVNVEEPSRKNGLTHSEIVHKLDSILHLGDKMKYDSITGNVNLCGVVFHVNFYENEISNLMTSVEPESRQMRVLVKAIAKNYGEPEIDEEEMIYVWPSFLPTEDKRDIPYIRIRRVHGDIGGSVMFFD